MLTHKNPSATTRLLALQRGVVLIIVLIVLVAMTIAGLALMRSVNTSTMVAGNLAFRQSTVYSGDYAIEQAINWLQANATSVNSGLPLPNTGYIATDDISTTPSIINQPTTADQWGKLWNTLEPNPVQRPVSAATSSGSVMVLPPDSAGNTVAYVIHQLCSGTPGNLICVVPVTSNANYGQSQTVGGVDVNGVAQKYYRITVRIEGPHNTINYVQAIVSM